MQPQQHCKVLQTLQPKAQAGKTMETHLNKPPRRSLATTIPPLQEDDDLLILKPAAWFIKLITFQAKFITTLLSMVSEATRIPSRVAEGGSLLLRKLGFGFLGAVYVCLVLVVVMVVAVIVGVGLVQLWVEEPVFLREPLHFDYTDVHPTAVFSFAGLQGKKKRAVPAGHTFYVALVLLMPESDFNRQIGVFQVTAEVISTTGKILAKSSQPCMLRFRSFPVRLMRTFVMSIPLLLGISGETQKITIGILKHKEGNPPTNAIRASLQPRTGTWAIPELYTAEILMNSQLPWRKELVRNWKWTFYVWTSLYVSILLLIILVCCCKPIVFPTTTIGGAGPRNQSMLVVKEPQIRIRDDREGSDSFRRRQRSRSKRKALFAHEVLSETVGSSTSSVTATREDMSEVVEDSGGFTDAESVCLGG